MDEKVFVGLVAAGVSLVVAILTSAVTALLSNRSLRRQYQLEFQAEYAARQLLEDTQWRLRSFDVIRSHLGGFADDELRRTLVRCGAIRFTSKTGKELWGLLKRVPDLRGVTTVPYEPEVRLREGNIHSQVHTRL